MKVAQSCLTLCDPMNCSLPGSSVHRILQARIMVWVAILSKPGIQLRFPALQEDSLPYVNPKTPLRGNNCSNYFGGFSQYFAPESVRIGKYPISFIFLLPQCILNLCITLRFFLLILLFLHFITYRHCHHHPSQ